jgi:tRNA pseudouridine38-40 synthase
MAGEDEGPFGVSPPSAPAESWEAPSGVLLSVAYDGGPFHGFATQPAARTVAGEILGAVQAIDPHVSEVRGASRTDAGVHARDQRVAFDPARSIPPRGWLHEINKQLPREIAVRSAREIERRFAPRFHSIEKTYRYLVLVDGVRDPLREGRAWRVTDFDLSLLDTLRAEARELVGTHDFAGFRSAQDEREVTVRTIHRASVELSPDAPVVTIDVTGSGFMHNMVRIIVGALVDIGRRRLGAGAIASALASKDRRKLGITAPAEGLYLWSMKLDVDPPT